MLTPAEDLWARMLAQDLAIKAKELTRGMLERVDRLPDTADFLAAFQPIVFGRLEQNEQIRER